VSNVTFLLKDIFVFYAKEGLIFPKKNDVGHILFRMFAAEFRCKKKAFILIEMKAYYK